ncbi:uncharacterized protein SOCE836_043460 [Sorangium cellulosum]|uniref:Uncharacterized protein n=1 Tax=Sorangium cellulosum TaxID=56 RepID=A0A4P2QPW4_SORCE|nr:uncharacterized protein SOCE836_043460 [Sorangium cellulosum]WCQ91580.1 hypothetical protein NQZ70_04302 [Sorangium sp. Soce836]
MTVRGLDGDNNVGNITVKSCIEATGSRALAPGVLRRPGTTRHPGDSMPAARGRDAVVQGADDV